MKTVLIRPSNLDGSAYLTGWGFLPAPLGLLQLAGSLLTLDDSQVKVIDMEAGEEKTVEDAVEEALRFEPDIVGLTVHATAAHATAAHATATEIAKRVKEERKDTLLVAGGHHATARAKRDSGHHLMEWSGQIRLLAITRNTRPC